MKPAKELFFIVNEHSGSGKGRHIENLVKKFQDEYDFTAELHKTASSGHAFELAERVAKRAMNEKKQPILVAVGGDGTLNEVVSGLGESYQNLPVGCIPTGSGNDFARSHHLPLDTEEAFHHLLKVEKPTSFDVLTYADKQDDHKGFAVNSLGIGIDAAVIHLLNQSKRKEKMAKSGLGKSSYLSSVISAYFKQKPFSMTVTVEGKERLFHNCILLLSTNNPYFGGGLKIHPSANPEDGKLNLIIAEKLSFLELLHLLYLILTKGSHLSHPKVHTIDSESFSLKVHSSQFGQADGEELPEKEYELDVSTFKRLFWI